MQNDDDNDDGFDAYGDRPLVAGIVHPGNGLLGTAATAGFSRRELRARMARGEPPASAEEYLLRVRLEAGDMPEILAVDNGTGCSSGGGHGGGFTRSPEPLSLSSSSSSPNASAKGSLRPISVLFPDPVPCPPALRPAPAWRHTVASGFVQLRQYLVRVEARYADELSRPGGSLAAPLLPPLNDGFAWEKLCFGTDSAARAGALTHGKDEATTTSGPATTTKDTGSVAAAAVVEDTLPPLLRVVVSLKQQQLRRLLNRHISWMCSDSTKSSGGGSASGRPLTRARAAWIYALMVRLALPLHRDTASMLRRLARQLSTIRAASVSSASDPRLASINLILALIDLVFGQGGG